MHMIYLAVISIGSSSDLIYMQLVSLCRRGVNGLIKVVLKT